MPFAVACPKPPDTGPAEEPERLPPVTATDALRRFTALAGAGYRRYSTYRQAAVAGLFTNTVFGAMLCAVMLAAAAGGNTPGGYTGPQLVTFVWVGQGLLNVVYIWGWRELAERVSSGEVTGDLLRPVDPLTAYAAADLGRAAQAVLTRGVPPVVFALVFYDCYLPQRAATYPLFAVSVLCGTLVSFAFRYLVNLTAFWLLDVRGPVLVWALSVAVLSGNYFPLRFLPEWAQWAAWFGTPFPSVFQTPLDIAVERQGTAQSAGLVLLQIAWGVVLFVVCVRVQRRAVRRLVVQGG